MGTGILREARQRRNVLSPRMIKDLAVQTDRQSLDCRERDTELTSTTLNAAGSLSLARSQLVHEACIAPNFLVTLCYCYDIYSFFSPCDRFRRPGVGFGSTHNFVCIVRFLFFRGSGISPDQPVDASQSTEVSQLACTVGFAAAPEIPQLFVLLR